MIIKPTNEVLLLGWESVAESQKKGFLDFDFITWMAWTWQTAVFFGFIFLCLVAMIIWEKKDPGGNPRRGISEVAYTKVEGSSWGDGPKRTLTRHTRRRSKTRGNNGALQSKGSNMTRRPSTTTITIAPLRAQYSDCSIIPL